MSKVIEIENRFYILAGSGLGEGGTRVLKHGDTFAIFNALGDIEPHAHEPQGIFSHGMRHVSQFHTRIAGTRPILLSSRITDDNAALIVDLTNPDLEEHGHVDLRRGDLHINRVIFLRGGVCHMRLTVTNFSLHEIDIPVEFEFECDFMDIFEIRGSAREQRGDAFGPTVNGSNVMFRYHGLDGVMRQTQFEFGGRSPANVRATSAKFSAELKPRSRARFYLVIRCDPESSTHVSGFAENAAMLQAEIQRDSDCCCRVSSSNRLLDTWLQRSLADVRMLMTNTDLGPYPYAGVPWFSTPFGRDGIITALEMLWVNPEIARGVLAYLAASQAERIEPDRDAEPGKILHERRTNEMAATREVPFERYYGSVDATPLFVVLAGEFFQVTYDLSFIQTIWPNILRAMDWIDEHGDSDGDGFVEYASKTQEGLVNQGWKDSFDSVFHADGTLASGPIALCEVQGYVYDAKMRGAMMADALGEPVRAAEWRREAAELKSAFHEKFWSRHINSIILALDGEKSPCEVRASNAGHCLYSGIVDGERARRVSGMLLHPSMNSGWGVRTVASTEARYNPMSYHNGSIWPHDNAMLALGLSRCGFRDQALRVFRQLLDAASCLELHRMPELYCGFRRRKGDGEAAGRGPTLYPVACNPQAWAAGSVFMLLAACLGLSLDGASRQVHLHRPRLPRNITDVILEKLRIGDSTIDLHIRRAPRDVGVFVTRKVGTIDLVITK